MSSEWIAVGEIMKSSVLTWYWLSFYYLYLCGEGDVTAVREDDICGECDSLARAERSWYSSIKPTTERCHIALKIHIRRTPTTRYHDGEESRE